MTSQYAIVQLAGKQFKVSVGDTIILDTHITDENTMKTESVLLVGDDKDVTVGTPLVAKASVEFDIINEGRGPKIDVRVFRNKSRYRKHIGHRQDQTVLKVTKITS